MNDPFLRWLHRGTLLAITLLFLMVWGFAGISKVQEGIPSWFGDKFGGTILAWFPGLRATFWILTISEVLGFAAALVSLLKREFMREQSPRWLLATLVSSLFIFLQLGFGQWLTKEFTGGFQMFVYFTGTLIALNTVSRVSRLSSSSSPVD